MRRTKIVCTLGPATDAAGVLPSVARAGLDVARLNFSHGTYEEHERRLAAVRELAAELDRPIAILQDLCGPKLRVGVVANGPVYLPRGHRFTLTSAPRVGGPDGVAVTYAPLLACLQPGERILLADGLPQLRVESVAEGEATTVVTAGGPLDSHQGINAPDSRLDIPAVTEKDLADLRWGLAHEVDYVAASFVRHADDLAPLREEMTRAGRWTPIIAKIERRAAITNLPAIIEAADGIMVARGDLGVEMPIEQVPMLQKEIIRRCNIAAKPVITATQMLESMMTNPRPTRAEVSDIANAILDGSDAVMLSGETAVGRYPRQAAATMARVAVRAEALLDHAVLRQRLIAARPNSVTESISEAATGIADDLAARALVTSTSSGYTALMVSSYRPATPILGITPHEAVYRRLALVWGVQPVLVGPFTSTDEMLHEATAAACERGALRNGDTIVVTAGLPVGVPGHTNLIRVGVVGETVT